MLFPVIHPNVPSTVDALVCGVRVRLIHKEPLLLLLVRGTLPLAPRIKDIQAVAQRNSFRFTPLERLDMRHDAFRPSYFKYITWVHSFKVVGLAAVRTTPPFGLRPWKGVQTYRCYSAKTQTIVQLREPLGKFSAPKKDPTDTKDGPTYPTVVSQARENMDKHDDCVLLTKVGSFYEIYFEQAEKWGPLLNLKVAQKFTAAGNVPMVSSTNAFYDY